MYQTAKTHWVWSEKGEKLARSIGHTDRKAGEPLYEHYRHCAPKSWVDKGYIEEAKSPGDVGASTKAQNK